MSIWKYLLLHNGFIATPHALRHVLPELAPPAASHPEPPTPEREPSPPPWARAAVDHLLIR